MDIVRVSIPRYEASCSIYARLKSGQLDYRNERGNDSRNETDTY